MVRAYNELLATLRDVHDDINEVRSAIEQKKGGQRRRLKTLPELIRYPSKIVVEDYVGESVVEDVVENYSSYLRDFIDKQYALREDLDRLAEIAQVVDAVDEEIAKPMVAQLQRLLQAGKNEFFELDKVKELLSYLTEHPPRYWVEKARADCERMVEAGLLPDDWVEDERVQDDGRLGVYQAGGFAVFSSSEDYPFGLNPRKHDAFLRSNRDVNALWEEARSSTEQTGYHENDEIPDEEWAAFEKILRQEETGLEEGRAVATEHSINIFDTGHLLHVVGADHHPNSDESPWTFADVLRFPDSELRPGSKTMFAGTVSFYLGLTKAQVKDRIGPPVTIVSSKDWVEQNADRIYYSEELSPNNMSYEDRFFAVAEELGLQRCEDQAWSKRRQHGWEASKANFWENEVQLTGSMPYDAIQCFVVTRNFTCQFVYLMSVLAARQPAKARPIYDERGNRLWPP